MSKQLDRVSNSTRNLISLCRTHMTELSFFMTQFGLAKTPKRENLFILLCGITIRELNKVTILCSCNVPREGQQYLLEHWQLMGSDIESSLPTQRTCLFSCVALH